MLQPKPLYLENVESFALLEPRMLISFEHLPYRNENTISSHLSEGGEDRARTGVSVPPSLTAPALHYQHSQGKQSLKLLF